MAQFEFDIIERYFRDSELNFRRDGLDQGIGDDCALLTIEPGNQLALSMDLLQEGVHFPASAAPELLGRRALAVNLSDLAAVGAEPVCFTMGLSLPELDEGWLKAFCSGLSGMAQQFNCPLAGGDLIRGAAQIAIQVQGKVPTGQALMRSGAKSGHLVYVTGTLGDAAAALVLLNIGNKSHSLLPAAGSGQQRVKDRVKGLVKDSGGGNGQNIEQSATQPDQSADTEDTGRSPPALLETGKLSNKHRVHFERAFYTPQPRIAVGQALRGLASAAIDISDGLLSDLGHITKASGVGAELDLVQLPFSRAMKKSIAESARQTLALTGGDDYELCITVPPEHCTAVEQAVAKLGVPLTRIGEIVSGEGIECLDSYGEPVAVENSGYSHFQEGSACNQL